MVAIPTPEVATATQFGVHSEVGKLRRVMIHRPDLELKRLTPDNHDELLFDDVLWVRRARQQHDAFADLLRDRGVEVLYLETLLAETLADADARAWVLDRAVTSFTVGAGMADEIRAYLDEVDAGHARRPPHRRPDRRGRPAELLKGRGDAEVGTGAIAQRLARRVRDGAGRLRAPAAAEQLLHPRPLRLDLRRRRRQPDVLAGAPARGAQRRGDLPLPPALPRRGVRVLVLPRAGGRVVRPRRAPRAATSCRSATGRSPSAWASARPAR